MTVFALSRRVLVASLIATPALAHSRSRHASAARRISVTVAIDRNGRPTPQWIGLIKDRIDANELAGVRMNPRALSGDDNQWIALIRQGAPEWMKAVGQLDASFRPAPAPPASIAVVIGADGGDDAFWTAPDIIAFDLSALGNAYGTSDPAGHPAQIDRLLSREYTRLRLNAYLAGVGWSPEQVARDPFLAALRGLYVQGLATLRGIEGNPRWLAPDGTPTPEAKKVLAELQPVMVERLKGLLVNRSPDASNAWLREMTQGPLNRRWGALPMALWLASDTNYESGRIATWIEGNPDGILQLAAGQADRKYQRAFADLQAAATDKLAGGH
jgi:hypothetical protein